MEIVKQNAGFSDYDKLMSVGENISEDSRDIAEQYDSAERYRT